MAPQSKLHESIVEDGKKLDLSMSSLTEVPVKDIAAIKKATSLDLSNNQLTVLPPSFSSLTHLMELDLSKNMLRELPESFGSLTNLKRLDLYGNQLTHLPLSFCNLKALRWLDLKNNPLVPMLAEIAGPCGDTQQCQQCARNVVAALTQTAIKVEEDRKRLLQEKLRQQEQIEQEFLMKKKQLDAEEKKSKKKSKKGKTEKPGEESTEFVKTAPSGKHITDVVSSKELQKKPIETEEPSSLLCSIIVYVFRLFLGLCALALTLFVGSILFAAYDRKWFFDIANRYDFIPDELASFILYFGRQVEYSLKHPTVKEMKSQLAACFQSIVASVLHIYKTICQEFPAYYDALKNRFF